MDVEATETVHPFELFEPIEWYFAGTCHELEKLGSFFFIKGTYRSPEPLDLWRRGLVVVVLRIVFPVINVDVRETGDEKLEFLFVENGDEICWHNVMEA